MSTFSKLDDLLTYIFKNELDPNHLILNIEVPKQNSIGDDSNPEPTVAPDLALPTTDPMTESIDLLKSLDTPVNITINNFSVPVDVSGMLTKGIHNTIYVDECESLKNACGTGRVEMFGRTVYTNVCEMDDQIHIKLNVTLLGESKEVDFEVKLLKDKPTDKPIICLSK